MDFIDYRKKLGINFFDDDKQKMFVAKVYNYIENGASIKYSRNSQRAFCNMIGIMIEKEQTTISIKEIMKAPKELQNAWIYLSKRTENFPDFLSCVVALINTYSDDIQEKEKLKQYIIDSLEQCSIKFDILEDSDGIFVFPKGAKELDDALVSEPLEWLKDYPKARKTYITALKQYSDGVYIRDTADNLRKALETFLQEFLNNNKNLETNKTELGKYFATQNVDSGFIAFFQSVINTYKNVNDRAVKHNDAVDEKLLEFLLYQTGVLIRMVLSIK